MQSACSLIRPAVRRTFGIGLVAAATLASACSSLGGAGGAVPPGSEFLSRRAWGANPPVLVMERHTPASITIHHTATRQNPQRPLADKMRGLQRFSQTESPLASGRIKPVWGDIPYHFYIDAAGHIAEGRALRFVGDSNTAYDPAGHLQIVLEGNFEEEVPTPAQLESLARLTWWHARRWGVSADSIFVHRDHAETLCPGRNLEHYIPWLQTYVGG
jgi:hypothetical protein